MKKKDLKIDFDFRCEHCGKEFTTDFFLQKHYSRCEELEKLREYE